MKTIKKLLSARISEIFSSIQGEGIYAGEPHIFVRFHGCNMNCAYCDTPFECVPEETNLRAVIDRISDLNKDNSIRTISLTGGEPLLHVDFLKMLIPHLKKKGYKFYADTNGTLADKLKEIADLIDIVAMDIKPPSATRDRPFWDEHKEFLIVAKQKSVFIKLVVTAETLESDFNKTVELIANVDKDIPLILQPVTPSGDFKAVPEVSVLNRWQKSAASKLRDVRIIPQMHKIWGVR